MESPSEMKSLSEGGGGKKKMGGAPLKVLHVGSFTRPTSAAWSPICRPYAKS